MMELLENILIDSIKGKREKLGNADISYYINDDYDVFISTLFNCLKEIIEEYPKTNELYDIEYFFDYIKYIKENSNDFDENNYKKNNKKIEKRIDYIISEKIKNKKKLVKKLSDFKEKLSEFKKYITSNNNLEDDFINYLLNKPRDINYIDLVFKKMPDVMKIKDKKGISLYNNIIYRYYDAADNNNLTEIDYYKKLLLLMNTNRKFEVSEKDKRNILKDIYDKKNALSHDKKRRKQNVSKIQYLSDLKNIIKTPEKNENTVEEIANKYNIEITFDKKFIDAVKEKELHLNKKTYDNRKIIKDYVLSIDGKNSAEIDDALSCKKLENGNYLLGIHIASILGYFNYYSDIVQNAFNRVHSIYLDHQKINNDNLIPIFPLLFSANYGSLLEGQERLTRSYLYEIDKKGNIVNEDFIKSIIINNKQSTYEEIDEIIECGCDNKKLNDTIKNLKEVTKLLRNKYKTSELYEIIKENNDDLSDLKVKGTGSQEIVYRTMTLNGNRVANYFAENNYPCLYRVHSVPEKVNYKIESLVNNLVDNYGGDQKETLYKLVSQIYPKSTYDTAGSHFGLKLDHYCHCTSGLRRCADILVEHALEVCYDKVPTIDEISDLYEEIKNKRDLIKTHEDNMDLFVQEVHKTLRKRKRKS